MKKKSIFKGCVIGFTIVLMSMLAMYLGLTAYYGNGFGYGTWINGVYCTGKSIYEVNDALLKDCHYEGLTITDCDGKSYTMLAENVNLTFDFVESLELFQERENPYLWIDNLIGDNKERKILPVVEYDETLFQNELDKTGFLSGKADEERKVSIQKGEQGYYLINERIHVLDKEYTKEVIKQAFEEFQTEINLEEMGCYRDLPLDADMEETLKLWNKLDAYQNCGIIYQFGEEKVAIDKSIACEFLLLDDNGGFVYAPDGTLCTDTEKVHAFVDKLADEYDTVGSVREFQATRGETVLVEGGIYGNKIDRKAEKEYLLTAFLEKRSEVHTPIYTQMGKKQGKDDIGSTYIEVDMTNQMMYYYVDGKLEISTPVVTGNTSLKRGTPCGTNYVYAKQRNRVLRGADYESFVKYWIPVNGGIGIHDASWRSEYGGELYITGGSHGCINTPLEEVSKLYEMVEIGTPCVMFY